ncbi:MAG TPA: NAD(P)/FAD-dependent oxidoreductase [Solirubrobacteraceae bacterium]|jgi:dihydrolipoamide dehydrogenase|nr:NAD(P)/FAD-dependent oxidoreductase [Solirubrobacteraceae bacterium]
MSTAARDSWDVVVIGGGPPGENAAQYAIQGSDRSAVIVEAELVGGECSYWACMPSKALLRPVELIAAARAMPGVAQILSGPLDVSAVLARRDDFTHHHDDGGQVKWASGAGIDVVRGRGRLSGPKAVEVTASDGSVRTIRAAQAVVLATGTTAAVPPVPGLREARPWTSRDVTNLREVPERVVVVGGGVVACESTTWLHELGAREVTVIELAGSLLADLEPFAGEILASAFERRGVTVLLDRQIDSVQRPAAQDTGVGRIHGGPATIVAGDATVEVDEIVVAAGRTPTSQDLGLERIGVDVSSSHGFVTTDDHMAVPGAEDWLYAVGDINGRALLTHMGKYQGRIAGDVIAARAEGRAVSGRRYRDVADHDMVPAVVFTDPQVASVGLTESAAREKGIDTEVLEYDLAKVAGASLLRDDYTGRAKLVVDQATDTLVGATFVGAEIAELLHSATTAIVGKVTLDALWHAVPSYPTASEVWLRLLEARRP